MSNNSLLPDENTLQEPLTQRELEILTCLGEGLSNKEIAGRLFLTVSTIKWYNRQIYGKLNVDNRRAAVLRATELGLLERSFSTTNTRHNLPAELTPFIGRKSELTELAQKVHDPKCRLVTILAPGGMGKTRLALRCVRAQLENYPSGVFYVPLAPLRSSEYSALSVADFVVTAIGDALNFPFSGETEPQQQLLDYFREKVMLLVIDNCEHLLEGVSFLSEILAHAPHVKVIATSRERLRLFGETVYVLGGMDFPNRPTTDAPAYGAIRLFVETARRAQTSFALDEDNLEHIIRICQLVDGMPLGIELAAGWSKLLSAREIAEEISSDLDMLTSQQSDLPPRLRSTRTVFEYSWNRLTAPEREVFMKLSIFRGGLTREAAQAVTGATLTTLSGLVDKSLLWHTPDHRYEIHELLRQYAREHLEASGKMDAAQDAHCLYYLGLLSQLEEDIKGRRQLAALNEVEADFENIRAAWDWALTRKFYDALNQTPESLLWFCSMRGYMQAGIDLFRRAQTQIDPWAEQVWGRLVSRGARLRVMMKDYNNVLEDLQECLRIAQMYDSRTDIAFCLGMLGNAYLHTHDESRAIPLLEKSLDHYRQLDDTFYVGLNLFFLSAGSGVAGRPLDLCLSIARQSLELMREIGNISWSMWPLVSLGEMSLKLDNITASERYFSEGYVVCREFNNQLGTAWMASALSDTAFFRFEFDRARALAQEAPDIGSALSHPGSTSRALSNLAYLALVDEEYARSHQLFTESLPLAEYRFAISATHRGAGLAACGKGDFSMSRTHLRAALDYLDKPQQSIMTIVPILILTAIILAHQGDIERAVEMLGCAHVHANDTVRWLQQWQFLARLYADLESKLGHKVYIAAWERGKQLDLETVWTDLQAEVADWS